MGGANIETADLLRVDPDGSVHQVADGLWFPNGSVITDDGVLIVDETFGNRISAFDIAPDGSLGPRRDWARFGDLPPSRVIGEALPHAVVAPDGCGLDAEGLLWVADAVNGRVLRVREGGEIAEEIAVGHRRVRLHARRVRRAHAVPVHRPGLRRGEAPRRPRGGAASRSRRRRPRREAVAAGRCKSRAITPGISVCITDSRLFGP